MRKPVDVVIFQGEEPDDDETFQVITTMKKIAIFYACHNLGHWNIWLVVFNDFRNAVSGQKYLPDEVRRATKPKRDIDERDFNIRNRLGN